VTKTLSNSKSKQATMWQLTLLAFSTDGNLALDDGTSVQISECPNGHGKIKSPMCCGDDMSCSMSLSLPVIQRAVAMLMVSN
jgi:hypothetical protein